MTSTAVAANAADVDPQPLAPLAAPAAVGSTFQGSFFTLGRAYGISTSRRAIIAFGSSDLLSPAGPSIIASIGHNLAFQNWVVGIEIDGRWGWEKTQTSFSTSFPPPEIVNYSYAYNNDAAAHVAGRLGAAVGDTLIFGKAGVGASRLTETYSASTSTTVAFARSTRWTPSIIFGAGMERNFGRLFGRLTAEVEAAHTNNSVNAAPFGSSTARSEVSWTTRGTAAVGVRF